MHLVLDIFKHVLVFFLYIHVFSRKEKKKEYFYNLMEKGEKENCYNPVFATDLISFNFLIVVFGIL